MQPVQVIVVDLGVPPKDIDIGRLTQLAGYNHLFTWPEYTAQRVVHLNNQLWVVVGSESPDSNLCPDLTNLILVDIQFPGVAVQKVIFGNEAIVIGVERLLKEGASLMVIRAFTTLKLPERQCLASGKAHRVELGLFLGILARLPWRHLKTDWVPGGYGTVPFLCRENSLERNQDKRPSKT